MVDTQYREANRPSPPWPSFFKAALGVIQVTSDSAVNGRGRQSVEITAEDDRVTATGVAEPLLKSGREGEKSRMGTQRRLADALGSAEKSLVKRNQNEKAN